MAADKNTVQVPFHPRHEIELKAQDVLRKHGLKSIPINPVVLAEREGFQVNNAKFSEGNLSGMIAKRGDNLMILVRAEDSPNRKRFTIAHELSHHFLHLLGDGEFVDDEADLFREDYGEDSENTPSKRRAEIQANIFASALLMPEDHIRALWNELRSVSKMASLFGVSEEAMGYRLARLGISSDD